MNNVGRYKNTWKNPEQQFGRLGLGSSLARLGQEHHFAKLAAGQQVAVAERRVTAVAVAGLFRIDVTEGVKRPKRPIPVELERHEAEVARAQEEAKMKFFANAIIEKVKVEEVKGEDVEEGILIMIDDVIAASAASGAFFSLDDSGKPIIWA